MDQFIPISKPSITDLEISYLNKAITSGWISSLGEYINKFENKFAEYCGTKHAVCVSNGTVGLHLVLSALNIKMGDEVIVPDFTFIATANAVSYTGAKPIFCDIDPNSLCIEPKSIIPLITKRTKAIIPVHVYGHPANMNEINRIAIEHNLYVIEDAAEAHGAKIFNKKVGSFGNAGIFSFYGNKIITTGEGGMITTNDSKLYEKILFLRDHAMDKNKRYWHTEIGFNYRLTNLQAAVGLAQLERIENIIQKKILIYTWYKNVLGNINGFRLNQITPGVRNVFWMICLEIDGITYEKREKLMHELKIRNIDVRPYFYPVSDMPMYERANTPVTHKKYATGINLPSYYDITQEEVQYICTTLKDINY